MSAEASAGFSGPQQHGEALFATANRASPFFIHQRMKGNDMNTQESGRKLHVDGAFEMEFVVAGEDEHGLPMLEVNLYPVFIGGMVGDAWALEVDCNHLVAGLTVPLEETGLAVGDISSLPLHEGWALLTTSHGSGLHV